MVTSDAFGAAYVEDDTSFFLPLSFDSVRSLLMSALSELESDGAIVGCCCCCGKDELKRV